MDDKLVIQKVKEEQFQAHSTRGNLYIELEKTLGVPVVSYFTSFKYPVGIDDSDAGMLEGILQKCDLQKGLALLISSPGGMGVAAERIINICRSYSGTGKYLTIVAGKAKSAATMICLGSSKMIMSKTSELGPIDPQLIIRENGLPKRFSIYNLVKSYTNLFSRAVREKGNLQPYLQQLANYDEREIAEYRSALALSQDIAVKALKTGMLTGFPKGEILKKIGIFLIPEKRTKIHGRPIYADEASKCGLNIDVRDVKEEFWSIVYELHVRLNNFVSTNKTAKCIECKGYSFRAKAGM